MLPFLICRAKSSFDLEGVFKSDWALKLKAFNGALFRPFTRLAELAGALESVKASSRQKNSPGSKLATGKIY
jgi:hypothetical protein